MNEPTECPTCGGEIYDNRQRKRDGKMSAKAPDFACKDKDNCTWVQWPPREKKPAAGKPGGNAPRPTGPLGPVYADAYQLAATVVSKTAKAAGIPFSMTDVTAAAATIFIQAAQSGRPVKAPKPEIAKPAAQHQEHDSPYGNEPGEEDF